MYCQITNLLLISFNLNIFNYLHNFKKTIKKLIINEDNLNNNRIRFLLVLIEAIFMHFLITASNISYGPIFLFLIIKNKHFQEMKNVHNEN